MLKIKYNVLSAALLSLVLVSFSAVAGKPVAISKGDGPNSLEIGLSVTVGEHKIMRKTKISRLQLIQHLLRHQDHVHHFAYNLCNLDLV